METVAATIPTELIAWLMGTGGLTGGLIIAVIWQHREINRLTKWKEGLLDTLLEQQLITPIQAHALGAKERPYSPLDMKHHLS